MTKRVVRQVRPTALIVGEGYAEVALLKHIRSVYTGARSGCALTVANARGKTASNVVSHAITMAAQASYDHVAVLLDTDAGWTPAVRQRAEKKGIALLLSEPCLEAWLLELLGLGRKATTQQHKQRFREHFGGEAHEAGVIPAMLPRALLDEARDRVPVLDQLLRLLSA